jgi:diguanylate cyclase
MTLNQFPAWSLRWFATLKFKIVAMTVATAVIAALSTTALVLTATRADLERLLLDKERVDGERLAAVLSGKLQTLQTALGALSRHVRPADWRDHDAMAAFLLGKPVAGTLFATIFAARPDGTMLARIENDVSVAGLPFIGDRDYFKQALQTDQSIVSDALLSRGKNSPIVTIVQPVLSGDGRTVGFIGGSILLRSSSLFSNLSVSGNDSASKYLVMDRAGTVLSHPDPERVLGNARDEPGLAAVVARWRGAGSPIDTRGAAELSDGHVVSMSGIPLSNWVLVHIEPESMAFGPLEEAWRNAWRIAIVVGMAAALLAGGLGWKLTRSISRLRARTQLLLSDDAAPDAPWPQTADEIGELARAFQRVDAQRQQRQHETQALLMQLEAVLDHAEVGIALTRNGRFELVSRQFCRTFRLDKTQVIGQPTRLIYASDEAYEALSARALPAFMADGAFNGELELMRGDGQCFWAQMRGRAVVPGDRSKGTIWTMDDVTEVREQRERLTWTSSHDSLTGLANRAAFEVLLERASARAASDPFCALFIDLDRFKQVNDTAGHAAGDAVLRDVANLLAAQVRKMDTVARLGGDEFAVLLDHCPVPRAALIAEKMRSAVQAYRLSWDGRTFGVGASIGLVPVDGSLTTAAAVLAAADAACYAAKRSGRNRVEVHGAA